MKRSLVAVFLFACLTVIHSQAFAAPIKAYISEFSVTPAEAGGLKKTLQTLLTSRLASDAVQPVSSAQEADVVIQGSYTQLGKMFSLDAVAKQGGERTLSTVFEQGEGQDDLIPAIGRLAGKLKAGLSAAALPSAAAPAAAAVALQPVPVPSPAQAPAAAISSAEPGVVGTTLWVSPRIAHAQLGLAPAGRYAEGEAFFVAENRTLRVYRQDAKALKQLAEVSLPTREKIIAIDSTGPDAQGNPRVYVSVMDGEAPASKIYSFAGGKLKLVAEKLPYLFRAIGLSGGPAKLFAQQMSITDDYYGDLLEMTEADGKLTQVRAIKLPRWANIYNYNTVPGPDGKSYPVVFSADGYLVVYSEAGEELWRSSEKFGGSETYFQREDTASVKATFDKMRWRFLDQRMATTKDGLVIVPQNAGFFVVGNIRSYSRYSLNCFTWTGASLEERWKTKQSQNYLADFFYKPESREAVLLEVVQKEGVFSPGGSALRVLKLD